MFKNLDPKWRSGYTHALRDIIMLNDDHSIQNMEQEFKARYPELAHLWDEALHA